MNATTDEPLAPLPAHRLPAHELALEAAAEAMTIAGRVSPRLRSVVDQLVRFAASASADHPEARAPALRGSGGSSCRG